GEGRAEARERSQLRVSPDTATSVSPPTCSRGRYLQAGPEGALPMTRGFLSLLIAVLLMSGAIVITNPWRAHAASSQTVITQSCAGGTVTATFAWQGNDASAREQWLDLSLFDNDWQPHSFMSAGPLSAATSSLSWAALPSKVPFVARVNQLLPDGT